MTEQMTPLRRRMIDDHHVSCQCQFVLSTAFLIWLALILSVSQYRLAASAIRAKSVSVMERSTSSGEPRASSGKMLMASSPDKRISSGCSAWFSWSVQVLRTFKACWSCVMAQSVVHFAANVSSGSCMDGARGARGI